MPMTNFCCIVARNNLLRKAAPDVLCAFLCSAKGSEFITIRVTSEDGTSISLQQISVIPSPEFDLIEFDVNYKRIWGLWCNSHGEYNVSSYSLVSNGVTWSSAGLESLPERKIEPGSDPRQAYCSYIFYPGRFQREVIDRALVVSEKNDLWLL